MLKNFMNKPNERKTMNHKFDELTKNLAQSVTRRAALKKFRVGLAGLALALANLALNAQTLPANAAALRANAGNTFALSPTADPSVFKITADGVVEVSLMGNGTEHAELLVHFPASAGLPITLSGAVTLTSADGATMLKFTVTGTATPDPVNPAFFNNNYQATFTGGSGAFASASGAAAIAETAKFSSQAAGTGTWTMKGYVITPPAGP